MGIYEVYMDVIVGVMVVIEADNIEDAEKQAEMTTDFQMSIYDESFRTITNIEEV